MCVEGGGRVGEGAGGGPLLVTSTHLRRYQAQLWEAERGSEGTTNSCHSQQNIVNFLK